MIINFTQPLSRAKTTINTLPAFLNKHFYAFEQQQLTFESVLENPQRRAGTTSKQDNLKHNPELAGKITEIITSDEEASSLKMLLPLLATLSKDDRWFAWVSPPKNLPKSLLKEAGIALDKILLLNPDDHNSALKLAKKALSAGTCHAVISWSGDLSEHELANLEHSANIGASHAIVIRRRSK